MLRPRNILEFDPGLASRPEEDFEPIITGPGGLVVERIVSHGQVTPAGQWYDQDHDEWVLVLQGQAALAFEDGTEVALAVGDYLLLPRHVKHRVTRTSSPCVWLAVHGEGLQAAKWGGPQADPSLHTLM